MDNGSALNMAKIQTHFKQYAHVVVPSPGSKSGETATTACGKQLTNQGTCTVHGTADGQTIAIPFQDMDVELTAGNTVMFHEDGGDMRNRQSGKTIRIYEIEGVYYIKMKVGDLPNDQPTACDNKMCAMQTPKDFPGGGR